MKKVPESLSDCRCLCLFSSALAFEFRNVPVEMSGCVKVDDAVRVCVSVRFSFVCMWVCGVTRQSPRQSSPKVTEQKGSR